MGILLTLLQDMPGNDKGILLTAVYVKRNLAGECG